MKNTDMVIGIDDNDSLRMFRLFNEPEGRRYLEDVGTSDDVVEKLSWAGISGAANVSMLHQVRDVLRA